MNFTLIDKHTYARAQIHTHAGALTKTLQPKPSDRFCVLCSVYTVSRLIEQFHFIVKIPKTEKNLEKTLKK